MSDLRGPLPEIILCGYERGGTTLLSQIFRENGFVSGFEVGVLMCDSPAAFPSFQPYAGMLHAGWGLGKRITLEELCSGDFAHFYRRLGRTAYPRKVEQPFFDKTPIYMRRLGFVLQQTEFINKAVVITRDPRAVFTSWAKRLFDNGVQPKGIDREVRKRLRQYTSRYLDYFYGCIAHRHRSNVYFLPYEDLCAEPERCVAALGEFATGSPFVLETMEHSFNNVYGNTISTDNVAEFGRLLSNETQTMILEATQSAAPFFYQDRDITPYLRHWRELDSRVHKVIRKCGIQNFSEQVAGHYFEPETYLLRNGDVLTNQIDPRRHFFNHGKSEARLPS